MSVCMSSTPLCGLARWELKRKNNKVAKQWGWLNGSCSKTGVIGLTRKRKPVEAFCFFNPAAAQPILDQAFKEPVAFMGGMFAGLLRLDLNEEPLKEWVTRTVEASGITEEDIDAEGSKAEEEARQQIEIE